MYITISSGASSTYITQNIVFVGHLCSHCRNPVIKTVHIIFNVPAGTIGMGKAAEEEITRRAASDMKKAMDVLLSYLKEPTVKMYPGNTGDISYLGLNIPCPMCGQLESWQDKTLLETQPVLSGMSVFPDLKSAYEWARAFLESRKGDADRCLSSPEELNGLLRKKEEAIAAKMRLQSEFESGEAVQRANMLSARKERLCNELKVQGKFSKERKSIQPELYNCEEAIKNAESDLINERKRLETELSKAEIMEKDYSLLQTHYADGGFLLKKEESIALRLRENDESDPSGYAVSLQQLLKFVSLRVSPFEKNKDLLSEAMASGLLGQSSEKTMSQSVEVRQ